MTQSVQRLGYGLNNPWFHSTQAQDDFTLGPTKSTIQRLTWPVSSGPKNPGREVDNTPQNHCRP